VCFGFGGKLFVSFANTANSFNLGVTASRGTRVQVLSLQQVLANTPEIKAMEDVCAEAQYEKICSYLETLAD
jgi:hypothetical protein